MFATDQVNTNKDNDMCKIAKDIFLNYVLQFEIPESPYSGI
jgi:hypothetical protein